MPVIKVTKADIMMTTLVNENRFFSMVVAKIDGPTKSAAGDSYNFIAYCDVIEDAKFDGKQVPIYFNTKMMGNIVPLYNACTGANMTEAGDVDTDLMLGKKFDGKIGTRTYEGKFINEIQEYLPYKEGSKVTQAFA